MFAACNQTVTFKQKSFRTDTGTSGEPRANHIALEEFKRETVLLAINDTLYPCLANSLAHPAPIPLLEAVTIATFFEFIFKLFFIHTMVILTFAY